MAVARHPAVSFLIRLDAAGQYAGNLRHFLRHLRKHPERQTCALPNADITAPCGDPRRNKNCRAALFGSKKSDPAEARAAALTAFILDIDRLDTPDQLVAYFGVPPIEISSGIDRDGQPRGSRRYVMSKRGNDLVRRCRWMAALSATRCNPAARALYRRVVAKHPDRKAIAVGHATRKPLHPTFALWKGGKPFDPRHYPWEKPAPGAGDEPEGLEQPPERAARDQAAGHEPESRPARAVVSAACPPTVPAEERAGEGTFLDFAHLKHQLSLARVLEHLGLWSRLRGNGPQRRRACPIHRADGRGRTFSVNRDDNVFHCFDQACGKRGDVIGLWAELHHLGLRAAAIDLVQTFDLEPAPARGPGKRNG